MKPGDYVIKTKGRNKGAHGLVLAIVTNDVNNTIVEVLAENKPTFWPAQFVKLFKQEKKNG